MSLTNNAATFLVGEDLKAVDVVFNTDGKHYSYLCAHDVKEGDQVVVEGYNNNLKVVTVITVRSALDLPLDVDYEYKFVLSTIDTSLHDEIIDARNKLKTGVIRQKKRKYLDSIKEELGISEGSEFSNLLDSIKSKLPKFK